MFPENYYQKVFWHEVRENVKNVNLPLANLIDELDPDKKFPLIQASYRYGDLIVEDGITYLPVTDNKLLPTTDKHFLNDIGDELLYSPIPLFLVIQNSSEVFVNSPSRTVPLNIFYPGGLLGLFESIDYMFSRKSTNEWCVSAGARNLFALPKLSESIGFKRLRSAFNLPSNLKPRYLADHWKLFYHISRHDNFKQQWKTHILYFTKNWLTRYKKDKNWFLFHDYLFKNAWIQAQFAISKIGLSLVWENFADAIANRNLHPIPYLVDQIKHILLIASGRWPGFKIADSSDQAGPISELQKVLMDVYLLKKHFPSILHICSLEREANIPTYYSLSYPTLLEGSPVNKASSTIMIDIREIKHLIDTIKPLFNSMDIALLKNTTFDYFHVEEDKYREIRQSKELINIENSEICTTSQFWRGCIRISRDKDFIT